MSWTEQQIEAAWANGVVVEKVNSGKWRKDACGAWICRDHYASHDSSFGWEIDDGAFLENGGVDDSSRLRPLQWKNRACKKNGKLTGPVIANGGLNLDFS